MVTTAGAATVPTLDGLHLLGAAADSWEIVETELVGTIRMANGSTREQRLAPDPDGPLIRRWYGITLDYRHLGPLPTRSKPASPFPARTPSPSGSTSPSATSRTAPATSGNSPGPKPRTC